METNDLTITVNQTILDAVDKILINRQRAVLLVDNDNIVKGVLSEGDLLRSFFDFINPESLAVHYCRSDFIFGRVSDNELVWFELLKKTGVSILPILDEQKKLIRVFSINDAFCTIDQVITKK